MQYKIQGDSKTKSSAYRNSLISKPCYILFRYRRSLYPFGVKAILIEPGIFKTNMGSFKALSALCEKSWKQATPDARQEYGEEYFNYCE